MTVCVILLNTSCKNDMIRKNSYIFLVREQDAHMMQKSLMQRNMGPCSPLHTCGMTWVIAPLSFKCVWPITSKLSGPTNSSKHFSKYLYKSVFIHSYFGMLRVDVYLSLMKHILDKIVAMKTILFDRYT